MNSLTVGDLQFEVRRSSRRRSVQITVDRGGELLLSAPETCPPATMAAFVREKRLWIYTKLAEKESLPLASSKRFVSGEGFPYLGRSYRLLLVNQQDAPLKLEEGRFKMRREDAASGRDHIVRWYTRHALPWLDGRVERLRNRLAVDAVRVAVSDLGYRWGSCGKGTLNFHWRSILLPPPLIEYVVAHELVHLVHQHHGPEFWGTLGRVMPDYETRKVRLRELGPSLVW